MYCSNCGALTSGNFCSVCGAKLENIQNQPEIGEPSPFSAQTMQPVQNQILLKSKNCKDMLDERKLLIEKGVNRMLGIAGIIPLGAFVLQYLAYINDHNEFSLFSGPMLGFYLVYMIVIVSIAFSVKKRDMAFDDEYRRYCLSESLIIDCEKTYGTTTKGQFQLYFSQIKSVNFHQNIWPYSNNMSNELLIIKDVAGNTYFFNSFINSKDLKNIIEEQIRYIKNDKM